MYLLATRSFMSINKSITFIPISRFILVSKSPSFTFFIWIFTYTITFFHRRFVYIHTFFHCKIMCSCQFGICLYDIQQTSYERRLHHSHVAPSVPIWAEFIFALGKICPWSIRASTTQQSCHIRLRRAALLYIHTYLPGKMMML